MYYKIYTDIRNSGWQCLLDNKIDRLPVDVLQIARQCKISVKKDSLANALPEGEDARAFWNGDKWMIIYNDRNDVTVSRFAIAHELGHIFLGHDKTHTKYANVEQTGGKQRSEEQADRFALRLLCPACVLAALNIRTPEDIASRCRIPQKQAAERTERMNELYERNMFFKHELEIQVYKSFSEYIKSETKTEPQRMRQKELDVSARQAR